MTATQRKFLALADIAWFTPSQCRQLSPWGAVRRRLSIIDCGIIGRAPFVLRRGAPPMPAGDPDMKSNGSNLR